MKITYSCLTTTHKAIRTVVHRPITVFFFRYEKRYRREAPRHVTPPIGGRSEWLIRDSFLAFNLIESG
jgi:hypothetical protein